MAAGFPYACCTLVEAWQQALFTFFLFCFSFDSVSSRAAHLDRQGLAGG